MHIPMIETITAIIIVVELECDELIFDFLLYGDVVDDTLIEFVVGLLLELVAIEMEVKVVDIAELDVILVETDEVVGVTDEEVATNLDVVVATDAVDV